MDNKRLLLFGAFFITLLMIWQEWGAWQAAKNAPPAPVAVQGGSSISSAADLPDTAPTPGVASPVGVPGTGQVVKQAKRIKVTTDLLEIEIDTLGGDLRVARLSAYPVDPATPDEPFPLLGDSGELFNVAQSGLLSAETKLPNHHDIYTSVADDYSLEAGQDKLEVRLSWRGENGVEVDKIYTFHRGSYLVDLRHELRNSGADQFSASQYRQLQRTDPGQQSMFLYTYTGGVIYSDEERYEKIDFDEMSDKKLAREITDGWAAMIQHYFLSAWIPVRGEANHYFSNVIDGNRFILGLRGPANSVAPGAAQQFESQLYMGPKLQNDLEKIATGLELTVDYGVLTVLAQPLFWLLTFIYDNIISNWGWAIILLTIMIKAVFYKLSETSYKSMANMRKISPRLATLKERYGDDKQRFQQEMMKMYKTEKINPLGGCLPILVQIPVFIALYWMLLESVEMRQAPFIFWLTDLSSKDPYFVLPLLMGASMIIQQKLNPAPLDPIQAKVMMALPIIFTVFFAFFPSGLVLYWVVNNVLSIAQQWVITRRIENAGKP
ncbi:membrane protein insertase YidC [Solemya pervernicosa gill symbiont]|uniref:Membrane protein insertase YidC n=2 Tax=Gammaproteobacteria incertae sedis TaxID=118884 RepID=A0A1T2L4Q0_9GAMM|nr:membrane protein insertase YidC [Candidatus Reidiella endopervernicosa]OOZ40085.1 membrane protein insertase YidC [Solemya pervernicosa gill symbiont]QKQ25399.1 membrane protein insertase YidC [Candidatus Reidiella endopervernicosa]